MPRLRRAVVILNPPGTHHRDCFHSLDDRASDGLARYRAVGRADAGDTADACVAAVGAGIAGCLSPMAAACSIRRRLDAGDRGECGIAGRSAGASAVSMRASGTAWLARARAVCRMTSATCRASPAGSRGRPASGVFRRAFRRAYGCSPGDYLRQRRVEAPSSCCLVARTAVEVPIPAGFADQSHMSHARQRAIGHSPLQLRRLSRCRLRICKNAVAERAGCVFAQRNSPQSVACCLPPSARGGSGHRPPTTLASSRLKIHPRR